MPSVSFHTFESDGISKKHVRSLPKSVRFIAMVSQIFNSLDDATYSKSNGLAQFLRIWPPARAQRQPLDAHSACENPLSCEQCRLYFCFTVKPLGTTVVVMTAKSLTDRR